MAKKKRHQSYTTEEEKRFLASTNADLKLAMKAANDDGETTPADDARKHQQLVRDLMDQRDKLEANIASVAPADADPKPQRNKKGNAAS
jgi:hypothetical protein